MLNICNVDEEGRFGGPERRIVQVAQALTRYGIRTHVLYPELDSEVFAQHLKTAGVPNSQLKITRLSKERKILFRYICNFLVEIVKMKIFFHQNHFDLIHANGSPQFKVAIAAKLAGIPVVWHLNDTMMSKPVRKLFPWVAHYCADGFIVAGQRVWDYYITGSKLSRKPILEIHAPVDTNYFSPMTRSFTDEIETIMPKPALTVVTISGLNPTKGLEFFIEMAIRLYHQIGNINFLIAGSALSSQKKYETTLRQMLVDAELPIGVIKFLGLVNDVPALLRQADICVFSSVSEASPTSIWEAMSVGKPIVTTDVGSVGKYITNGVSGFIVPVRDVDKLSEMAMTLLRDPVLRTKMGIKARLVAIEQLDIEIAAQRHATIYRQVLGC
jgi:glycosyltransferase involved in cell wall biosynthesis